MSRDAKKRGASMSCEPYYGHDWQEGRYRIALHNDPFSDPSMVPVDVCSVCRIIRIRGSVYPNTPRGGAE